MRELTSLEPPGPQLCSMWGERLPRRHAYAGAGEGPLCVQGGAQQEQEAETGGVEA